MRNAYKIFVEEHERMRPLARPRHSWEVVRMDLREIGRKDVDWMHLTQDRDQWRVLVNTGSIKGLGFLG
jgi:hypothetical protein